MRAIHNYTSFELVKGSILAILMALLFLEVWSVLQLKVWRHDELIYLYYYDAKLQGEGRWINYFCFNLLKAVPPSLAWFLNILAFLSFFWIVYFRLLREKLVAAIFAAATVLLGAFTAQYMWPATFLLGPLILLFGAMIANRRNLVAINLLFGIVLFGVQYTFIFLLPLIWVGIAPRQSLASSVRLVGSWFVGFVVGGLVASMMTKIITGDYVKPDAFRQPNPADSLQDFINNGERAFGFMVEHAVVMLTKPGLYAFLVSVLMLAIAGVIKFRRVGRLGMFIWLPVAASIPMAFYSQSVPLGVVISLRTAWVAMAGVLFLLAIAYVLLARYWWLKSAVLVSVLGVAANGFIQGEATLRYFLDTQRVLSIVQEIIEKETGVDFAAFDKVLIYNLEGARWDLHRYVSSRPPAGDEPLLDTNRWGKVFIGGRANTLIECDYSATKWLRECDLHADIVEIMPCTRTILGFCTLAMPIKETLIIKTAG